MTSQGTIGPQEAAAVLRLVDTVTAADGVGPLSEQILLHVRHGGDHGARNLLVWRDETLAGFAHLDAGGLAGELAVHPAYRGHGLGRALARALAAGAAGRPLLLWAHGDLPAAAALAASAGFTRQRGLWRMYRPLADPPPEPRLPPGFSVRTFVPGQDEQAWLAVNARAFADHPEQGRWTWQDLAQREQEPWFDPAGFFLAERDGRLAGFHWTKIHNRAPASQPAADSPAPATPSAAATPPAAGAPPAAASPPIGEVYVIGVDPSAQGTGLGRALTLVGLHYLRDRGLPGVMLYVDESNTPAIALYESLGFSRAATDVVYQLRA
ncbi:MAG TPA: mycothiol synthase [Streptosporangiaceae bacterium]